MKELKKKVFLREENLVVQETDKHPQSHLPGIHLAQKRFKVHNKHKYLVPLHLEE